MLEVLTEASQDEEDDSPEDGDEATVGKEIRNSKSSKRKQVLRRGKTKYYDRTNSLSWYWLPRRCWKMMDMRPTMQVLGVKKPMLMTQAKLTSGRMRFVWDY
jgi:hypothetical protein